MLLVFWICLAGICSASLDEFFSKVKDGQVDLVIIMDRLVERNTFFPELHTFCPLFKAFNRNNPLAPKLTGVFHEVGNCRLGEEPGY